MRFSALILVLLVCPPLAADPQPRHADVVFATVGDQALKLDLYLPEGVADPPLVVWIHGGGWRGGSKSKVPIRAVVQDGYALASIEYRFTDRQIFPAQIHDCKGAIRWLRSNAQRYGYRADWIAVAGSSAGGHLALLLGTSGKVHQLEGETAGNLDQSSSVQAVIDYYGPADFMLRRKTQPDRALTEKSGSFALLGGLRDGKIEPDLERLASPTTHVDPTDPPLLVFHGTNDKTVLLDQSQRIESVYRQKGLPVQLVTVRGAGHGGSKFYSGENLERVRSFLRSHRPD